MKRYLLLVLAACSSSVPATFADAGIDAPVDAAPRDSGQVADAGGDADAAWPFPVFASCDPDSGVGCTAGLSCFTEHTNPAWWADLYGHCSTRCADLDSVHVCQSQGGLCGCPEYVDGGSWPCTDNDHPPAPLVCVPSVRP